MRAVWMREFGAPEVLTLGEAPDPVAGPGQVVVDVEFANITFVETQFRATGQGPFAATLPMIPGNGVGGVVTATGPDPTAEPRHEEDPADDGSPGINHRAMAADATRSGAADATGTGATSATGTGATSVQPASRRPSSTAGAPGPVWTPLIPATQDADSAARVLASTQGSDGATSGGLDARVSDSATQVEAVESSGTARGQVGARGSSSAAHRQGFGSSRDGAARAQGGVPPAASGSAGAWVGRRVVTSTGGSGGYAERVVVDAAAVFAVPEGLALDVAVAVLADGRTATMMVRAASVRAGERVLVEAAAGGVGSLLVQLVVAAGGRVVAAVGGPRKAAVAAGLGAEVVVDYSVAGWAERVRDAVGGVDVVFDGVGGEVARASFGLLERGGRMVSFGLASGVWADVDAAEAAERGVTLVRPTATPAELRAYTESALAAAAEGRLRPIIGQRFPLGQASVAHRAIQERATVGKTLLVAR